MLASVLLDSLEHRLVLLGIARNRAIEIGRELDGSFPGIVDRREAIDERTEMFVRVIERPFLRGFCQKCWIQFAKLKILCF